jgi:hypothetical protein
MQSRPMTFPELMLIAGSRAMAGFGAGLLVAGRLTPTQRRRLGWPLLILGAASTIPLLLHVRRKPILARQTISHPLSQTPTETFVPVGL